MVQKLVLVQSTANPLLLCGWMGREGRGRMPDAPPEWDGDCWVTHNRRWRVVAAGLPDVNRKPFRA